MSAKMTVVLAAILLVCVSAGWWLSRNPGKKEFELEQKALENVTSWKITTQASRRSVPLFTRVHEAVCPDRERIVETAHFEQVEYIRIGEDVRYRKGNSEWISGMPSRDLFTAIPSPRPCLTDPGQPSSQPPGGAEEMRLAIQNDISRGNIEKGEIETIEEVPCRNWHVRVITEQSRMGSYNVCISESDHLPRQIQSTNQDFTIRFQWNVPVDLP
jgi:hypothetical protein